MTNGQKFQELDALISQGDKDNGYCRWADKTDEEQEQLNNWLIERASYVTR